MTATDDEGDKTKEVTVTVTAPGVQPPTVEAGANVTSGPARLTVAFTATGTDPDGPESQLTYTWEFGDGVTSFEQNPTHTYGTKGTYTAKVTVRTARAPRRPGRSRSRSPTRRAIRPRRSRMDPLPQGDRGGTVHPRATDPEDEALTYEWDFGDGSAKGAGDDVLHTFAAPGAYDVELTVKDPHGGTASSGWRSTSMATANAAPTVEIAADPTSGSAPLPVQFSSRAKDPEGGSLLYRWAFGDGGFSAEADPLHTFTAAGSYAVMLEVTDHRGAKTTATTTITVTAVQAAQASPKPSEVAAAAPAVSPWFGVARRARRRWRRSAGRAWRSG